MSKLTIPALAALALLALAATSSAHPAAVRHPRAGNGLIAFMRPGTVGEYDLWVVRPSGTGLRRLTRSPREMSDYNPDWSPDGKHVLFERRGGDGDDLWTVEATSGRMTRITDCKGDCWSDNEARWSSDGTQIAFGRATGPKSAQGPSQVAIYVVNADGSGARQLSHPPAGSEDHYPTWAPDGKTVVFKRDRSPYSQNRTKLTAIDVQTGAERTIYELPAWAAGAGTPYFSPSGDRIILSFWCIYGDDCPASSRSRRNARVATITPTGANLRILPLKTPADSGNWSPDGTRVVFRCWPKTGLRIGNFRLCTSKLNGTQLKRFPWPLDSAEPDWGTHP
jgi:Tol biopolymer transport system component